MLALIYGSANVGNPRRPVMNDDLPDIEFPEFATVRERLARNIEIARESISFRVGYEVEVAHLEPVEREGRMNMRIYWRRKPPELRLAG
jgi:hypothetical protein